MQSGTDPRAWWTALETQWQRVFRETYLNLPPGDGTPTDAELESLLSAQVLRCAGPTAPYPNTSVVLTNLSGLAELQELTFVSVTDSHIRDLAELARHRNLRSLFVQDNQLTSLSGIEALTELESLYAQNNQLSSLEPIRALTKLHTLYVSGNQLTSISGLTPDHGDTLRNCYILPNEHLPNREIIKLQQKVGLLPKRG
ncbi:Leucine-rich repeat (LRR) protein [Lewinella aquimaris]|uniref:Leucine-rich repeat (LRR) protein n=1 Tax=Neolewinella aquimaris TaxID=1835722 RepID=A0A840EBX6_9BACT|nr:leucine-rich repeat domain-containing protein [Neolewinella aquimaris]MBB4080957.1 Leucine-rich repeat (LRR) protein [Neolewinella aquimaris]